MNNKDNNMGNNMDSACPADRRDPKTREAEARTKDETYLKAASCCWPKDKRDPELREALTRAGDSDTLKWADVRLDD